MNKKQAGRLLTLAHFLKSLEPRSFNLANWVMSRGRAGTGPLREKMGLPTTSDGSNILLPITDPSPNQLTECGTAACAVGWATMLSVFQEEGFTQLGESAHPAYKGYEGWFAVQTFFGLESHEADHLFSANAYEVTSQRLEVRRFLDRLSPKATPQMVAERIEALVGEKGWVYA